VIDEKLHLACLGQQGDLLVGQPSPARHQVRAALEGPAQGLHPSPDRHALVVTRPEHTGNRPAAELRRPRVLGVLQEPFSEALVLGRGRVAQGPRKQTGHRLDHDQGRQLAACNYDVADRQLAIDQVVGDPLVHALVPAAQQREALCVRKLAGDGLIKAPAGRGEQEQGAGEALELFDTLDGGEDRLGHEHHPRTASERSVIDRSARI
jgi:hypothetical protein